MSNNNAFPSLNEPNAAPRSPASPAPQPNGNTHGYMAASNMAIPVGQQSDLNYLYVQLQELSSLLHENRSKVNEVTRNAEEVARRANLSNGHHLSSDNDPSSSASRVRDLELQLQRADTLISAYKREQTENTHLIGLYEHALGTATDQIRVYSGTIEERFLAQRHRYNDLLQAEKDEHLATRLDRNHWHAQTMKVCEMVRTAGRLQGEEWCDEYRVVKTLQEQVRCLRRVVGLEAEEKEEEAGWIYLRDEPEERKS